MIIFTVDQGIEKGCSPITAESLNVNYELSRRPFNITFQTLSNFEYLLFA
jgi:hypothetical protein